jgi:hypothetical protein
MYTISEITGNPDINGGFIPKSRSEFIRLPRWRLVDQQIDLSTASMYVHLDQSFVDQDLASHVRVKLAVIIYGPDGLKRDDAPLLCARRCRRSPIQWYRRHGLRSAAARRAWPARV